MDRAVLTLYRRFALALVVGALLPLAACGGHEPAGFYGGVNTVSAPPPPKTVVVQAPAAPMRPPAPRVVKVAILVPLSGENAALGQAMVDAAQMAVFDLAPQNFELMPRDTGATPEQAVAAARDAIANGANLILGPLFASSVAAIKPYAQQSGISILAFSNDASLAGGGAYVMGFTPEAQVLRVVAYAKSKGYHDLAALIPDNPYGAAIDAAAEEAAALDGVTLVSESHYAADPAEARDAMDAGVASLPAAKTYDSLLLPEGGNRLAVMAQHLTQHAIDAGPNPGQIRILGTGLWDEPGIGASANLVGAWYAASDPNARISFEQHFAAAYGHPPPRLATLAYDATALAAVASRNGWALNAQSLTNPNGFAGADGLFRLRPNGLAERGLAVLEVTPSGAKVVDPAPRSFVAPVQPAIRSIAATDF